MLIRNHIIKCKNYKYVPARKNQRFIEELLYIVVHYSASGCMSSTVQYLTDPDIKASANLAIDRDGRGTQMVPFNIQSWHAGNSYYKGHDRINRYSIGIELINEGKLKNICGTFYTGYGKIIPKEEVFEAVETSGKSSYWHKFTDKQMYSLKSVIYNLRREYPSIVEVIGHSDITKRKLDPGRAFPWDKI